MSNILDQIVTHKRAELAQRQRDYPQADLAAMARDAGPVRGFRSALQGMDVEIIAEIKRASPTAGLIRDDFDAASVAKCYQDGGAAAISVLTDEHFFKGSLEVFRQSRDAVTIPVLRKDFTLDPYQLYEARAVGADAVLLIVAILEEPVLRDLLALTRGLGMDALVEVNNTSEMEMACRVGADLVGVNNRDLKSFVTRLETTAELAALAPPGAVLAALSGIKNREDVSLMARSGADAVLVGESLMRQHCVETAVRNLTGVRIRDGRRTLPRSAASQ